MRIVLAIVALGMAMFLGACSPKAATAAPDPTAGAAAGQAEVTFAQVKSIVDQRCAKCHVEQSKGKLSLASLESAMAGGKSGPVVTPGNADGSLLYKMVTAQAGVDRMPPKGDLLSDDQRTTIKAWIDGGAK